ncbi:MAG: PQQ-binding-like beta-propeller repeat protein [Proteobacteria bacterium]|nr:PQQ-binding-like beta-propeller repeat protein [Pseudomonadota bacterium]
MPSRYLTRSLVKERLFHLILFAALVIFLPTSALASDGDISSSKGFSHLSYSGNYNPQGLPDLLSTKWDKKIGGPNRFQGIPQLNPSSPLIIGDTLYVGSSIGIFHAYSLGSGKSLWSFDAGSAVHAPAAYGNMICFGTSGGKLFCLDRVSGVELFNYSITSSISSAPVIDSERIYLISSKNRLHALNLTDGKKLWTYSQRNRLELAPRFINSPSQSKDKLFVLLSNGVLVAIEKATGKELWQRTILKGKGPWLGTRKSATYLKGNLYIIDSSGALLVLDAGTGSLRVVFNVVEAVDFIVTDESIIIASTEELISISRASGSVVWIEALEPAASNRIFGAGKHIYVVSVNERDPVYLAYVMRKKSVLNAYTIDDGTFIWKRKYKSSVSADIAVASDHLAILTDKGRLYVLGDKDE